MEITLDTDKVLDIVGMEDSLVNLGEEVTLKVEPDSYYEQDDSFDHEFGTERFPKYWVVESVTIDSEDMTFTKEQKELLIDYICEEFQQELSEYLDD
jgi:hypothetical protein